MRAFAMRWMPSAASSTVSPSGPATRSTAASASSRLIVIWPSATSPAGMRPSTTFASVTVGSTAAAAVAGGAGIGAGAARADLQAAGRVEPGDAAPAGADLGDVDRRDPQELARAPDEPAAGGDRAADLVLAPARDGAVLDQGRLGGRAAHVERDRVLDPEPLRHPERRDDSGGRPRLEREHRAAPWRRRPS